MTYVISDIHGCYAEFLKLIEKIALTDDDDLYILGDVIDRGEEPIKLILDLMNRPNVFLILGNHEFMMNEVLEQVLCEVTDELVESWEQDESKLHDVMELLSMWADDGGMKTLEQLKELSNEQRESILEYILEAELYVDLEVNGKRFILAHADLHGFDGDFGKLTIADICMYRADYSRRYFADENTFLITGHTPTTLIREDKQPLIYEGNGHIAIDCGCVFGGRLAAYCLETGEVFYEDSLSAGKR